MKDILRIVERTIGNLIGRMEKTAFAVYRNVKVVFVVALISAFIAYFQYLVTGFTSPDGITEGYTYFHDQDLFLVNGRWFVRYFNYILGHNIVMPQLLVIGFCVFISFSIVIISKMLNITNKYELAVMSAFMITVPSASAQLAYPYMFMVYGGAFFFSIASVYYSWNSFDNLQSNYRDKKFWLIGCGRLLLSVTCVALMFGLYQAYIGAIVTMVVVLSIDKLLRGDKPLVVIKNCVITGLCTISGALMNIKIYTWDIERRELSTSNRLDSFSLEGIFHSIKKTVNLSYYWVKAYYIEDSQFGRQYYYKAILVCSLIALIICIIKYVNTRKAKSIVSVLLVLAFVTVLPMAMNIVYILIPYNKINILMQYHYVLLLPLAIVLQHRFKMLLSLRRMIIVVFTSLIIVTYTFTANASWLAIKESYRAINTQTQLILGDVYDLRGYIPNETKIVLLGYPSEDYIQNTLEVYQFARGLNSNQAFWKDINGVTICRERYFKIYHGINAGHLYDDEFLDITEKPEIESMTVWPQKGSVKMVDGYAVVKLSENEYPRRE